MKVSFFDLKRIYFEERLELAPAIEEALNSGHYILGKIGQRFEAELKSYLIGTQAGSAWGCNSGTDAIVLSLLALGIGPTDEVLVSSHTAIPTITAIRTSGAKPIFCDVDEKTWVLAPNEIAKRVTSRTKAVVCVHLYGNMVPLLTVREVLNRLGRSDISIVEDVAQAMGSRIDGRQAGTLGDISAFSFYPTKNIGALGDGGAVFCKDIGLANRVKCLRNYGQKDRYNAEIAFGLNSRLDEIQAAVLSVRLKKLDRFNLIKRDQMNNYVTEFSRLPIQFQTVTENCEPAWHLAVIALESRSVRDDLMKFLEKDGVETLIHYPHPTHLQPAFRDISSGTLCVTESLANRIMSLPLNIGISRDEQEYVIGCVKRFFI